MSNHQGGWYGNDDRQTLITERSGLVLATIEHDGFANYYLTLYPAIFSGCFWRYVAHQLKTSWALRGYSRHRWTALDVLGVAYVPGRRVRLTFGKRSAQSCDELRDVAEEELGIISPAD